MCSTVGAESKMGDIRDCILCQQQIDLDEDGVTILTTKGGSRGRTTILDAAGNAHIVVKPKGNNAGKTAKEGQK